MLPLDTVVGGMGMEDDYETSALGVLLEDL
jgi:hypothetical protein